MFNISQSVFLKNQPYNQRQTDILKTKLNLKDKFFQNLVKTINVQGLSGNINYVNNIKSIYISFI